jgi:hypothetical protein
MSHGPFTIVLLLGLALAGPAAQQPAEPIAPVKDYELKGEAWQLMNGIRSQWMKNEYRPLLRKYGLRMRCSSCEYVYLDVQLTIDGEGKVTGHKVVHENRCGKPFTDAMRKDFLRSYLALTFPPELRKLVIETRLGTGLTC